MSCNVTLRNVQDFSRRTTYVEEDALCDLSVWLWHEARWRARLRFFLLVSAAVTVLSVCKKADWSFGSAIHTSTPAQAAAAYGITRWTGRLRYSVGSRFDARNVAEWG